MLCSSCGRPLGPQAIFCSTCGTAAGATTPESQRVTPTAPAPAIATQTKRPSGCLAFLARFFGRSADQAAPVHVEGQGSVPFEYRLRDDFLSRAEASFMHVLLTALGDRYLVCPKVNLGDLVYAPHDRSAWNRINRKHVDFVVCDAQTLRPVCAVELDDRSHQRPDRQERDRFVNEIFATAGLPILHVPVRSSYLPADLEAQFRAVLHQDVRPIDAPAHPQVLPAGLTPPCPKCGTAMVQRTTKKGPNIGHKFYGCPNYPRCQSIIAA